MTCFSLRKDVVNQLRQLDDDDWQVFSSDLLEPDDSAMEVQTTSSTSSLQRQRNREQYKNQVKNLLLDLI